MFLLFRCVRYVKKDEIKSSVTNEIFTIESIFFFFFFSPFVHFRYSEIIISTLFLFYFMKLNHKNKYVIQEEVNFNSTSHFFSSFFFFFCSLKLRNALVAEMLLLIMLHTSLDYQAQNENKSFLATDIPLFLSFFLSTITMAAILCLLFFSFCLW